MTAGGPGGAVAAVMSPECSRAFVAAIFSSCCCKRNVSMIHTTSLLEAREQAGVLARRGHTAYIYRLPNGVYWMTLRTPDEVGADLVERVGHESTRP
jgi:hypothetical protein